MPEPGESESRPAHWLPGQGWDETSLLAELAERQERLVSDLLSRAAQSLETAAENTRLAQDLAGSLDRLQEVHHRIRNHLQAVTGLLSAEEVAADSAGARRALRDSIARLTSVAAIHDLLARDPRSGKLCLRELVERLSQHLLAQVGATDRVEVRAQVAEVELDSKAMTALVLILTELLSNAIEHGFPQNAQGQVEVRLAQAGAAVRLTVKDNGPGLPPGFDVAHTDTLGLKLVDRLAKRDLGGRLSVRRDGGACFEVEFAISLAGQADQAGSGGNEEVKSGGGA
jgi:two-component sensor histidine kinase